MIPKLHAKGSNFRGAARYLLGEPGRLADRVAWTQTHNLITRNPEAAWRVMAATAMDQQRLKESAGVKNTGRKSKLCVLHFSLSWHAEEKAGLTAEEMARAARVVLKVMGAEEHQAMVVAHTDTPQPHVHVVVNRVHPRDGRMLSSSFEKLKASRWAQRYEEERGKVYCVERVLNNEARQRGEYRRGEKNQPRLLHDLEGVNDNSAAAVLREEHRKKSAALKEAERRLRKRTAERIAAVEQRYRENRETLLQASRQRVARQRTRVRERFRTRWRLLHHEQQAQQRDHALREQRVLGRVQNALRAIDLRSAMSGPSDPTKRRRTISEVFQLLVDRGARQEALRVEQKRERRDLGRKQRRVEKRVVGRLREHGREELASVRRAYVAERADLLLETSVARAKLRAQWLEKGRRFRANLRELGVAPRTRGKERDLAPLVALPATRASDLLPPRNADAVARRIDQWRREKASRIERRRVQKDQDERER
jgi:hypothetical protein